MVFANIYFRELMIWEEFASIYLREFVPIRENKCSKINDRVN